MLNIGLKGNASSVTKTTIERISAIKGQVDEVLLHELSGPRARHDRQMVTLQDSSTPSVDMVLIPGRTIYFPYKLSRWSREGLLSRLWRLPPWFLILSFFFFYY